jgi:Protein of unknown function (DUF2934)
MANAGKLTVKKKSSMRPPLAASTQPIELSYSMRERIARKAYELWQERGYRDGRDLEDWLDAEIIVMEKIEEARV